MSDATSSFHPSSNGQNFVSTDSGSRGPTCVFFFSSSAGFFFVKKDHLSTPIFDQENRRLWKRCMTAAHLLQKDRLFGLKKQQVSAKSLSLSLVHRCRTFSTVELIL